MSRSIKNSSPALRDGGGARGTSFKLEPYHRHVPDAVLLADLTRVAKRLGLQAISQTAYTGLGQFAFTTFCRRFGSWKSALSAVNLRPAHQMNVSADALLRDICRVAKKLKTKQLRYSEYVNHGRYSRKIIYRHFGRWQTAAEAARLQPVIQRPRNNQELFDNLKEVWETLGRQPRYEDLTAPLSKFGASAYAYRFGTFRNALKAFIQAMAPPDSAIEKPSATLIAKSGYAVHHPHRTPRTVNSRLRYMVLRRDHFRCCACGQSPATDRDIRLQIDHIKPWSRGGETEIENLQTLCHVCNSGKSDLPAVEPDSDQSESDGCGGNV